MNPWIIIALIGAGIVFLIDYIVRRKKWSDNTKAEKGSLILHMASVGVYVFGSILGLLWGITESGADTAFGEALYQVTLYMAGAYFVIALAAAVGSFVLRKKGKTKASIWINVAALAYIVIVLGISYLAGELF